MLFDAHRRTVHVALTALLFATLGRPRCSASWAAWGVTRIIEALGAFCSADAAHDIRSFFDRQDVPGSGRARAQTLEDIEACAALAQRHRPQLAAALDATD